MLRVFKHENMTLFVEWGLVTIFERLPSGLQNELAAAAKRQTSIFSKLTNLKITSSTNQCSSTMPSCIRGLAYAN